MTGGQAAPYSLRPCTVCFTRPAVAAPDDPGLICDRCRLTIARRRNRDRMRAYRARIRDERAAAAAANPYGRLRDVASGAFFTVATILAGVVPFVLWLGTGSPS